MLKRTEETVKVVEIRTTSRVRNAVRLQVLQVTRYKIPYRYFIDT